MRIIRRLTWILPILAALALGGCMTAATEAPETTEKQQVLALTREILSLGPGIDPEEAERAARIAYEHTAVLRRAYRITDPPLIHNMKVNAGLRPRGLCWHWAEDMEKRLRQENFRTLAMHRAIANADNPFRIDHSTAIIGRRGDTMFEGVVLDPWRLGGVLHWTRVLEDSDYDWVPRAEVHEKKRRQLLLEARFARAG